MATFFLRRPERHAEGTSTSCLRVELQQSFRRRLELRSAVLPRIGRKFQVLGSVIKDTA